MWKLFFVAIGCLCLASTGLIDDEVEGLEMRDDNIQLFTIEPLQAEPTPMPDYPSEELEDPPLQFPYEFNLCG